jgi:hypothetical protein
MGIFSVQCKVAQIIMVLEPGKLLEEASSYRLMSLLPIRSKIFKKTCAQRITPDTRSKLNPLGPSIWILTETLYHRTSALNYRDNKRKFIEKTGLLCGIPRRHTND